MQISFQWGNDMFLIPAPQFEPWTPNPYDFVPFYKVSLIKFPLIFWPCESQRVKFTE